MDKQFLLYIMNQKDYINKRLNNQITWYDNKSSCQKICYYISKAIVILCTTTIPIISLIQFYPKILSAVLAGIASISEGVAGFTKWHEKWIVYRTNAELLKREKYEYSTSSGPYSNLSEEEKFHLLVEQTEQLIISENVNWSLLGRQGKPRHGKA